METSWLGGRVPLPDLEEIIEGALEPVGKPMGPNARFGYPLVGGFQALMSGFLPHIRGKIELNADVTQLQAREHVIALADGRRFRYDHLISTMPLPELVKLIGARGTRNGACGSTRSTSHFRALRQPRHRARKHHGQALDLLSRRYDLPPYFCARQCQPALQSTAAASASPARFPTRRGSRYRLTARH